MVKAPRHSKSKPSSVTIDLDSKDVQKHDDKNPEDLEQNETKDASKDQVSDKNDIKKDLPKSQQAESQKAGTQESSEKTDIPAKKSGAASPIAAGLIGAVSTLLGTIGLQWSGILPAFTNQGTVEQQKLVEQVTTLETNMIALTDQLNQAPTIDASSNMIALRTRIDDLETLLQTDNTSSLTALSDLNIRIDQLTSRIINAETAVADQKTTFEDQIKQLSAPTPENGGETSVALNSVNLRLDQIETSFTDLVASLEEQIAASVTGTLDDETQAQVSDLLATLQQQQIDITNLTEQVNAVNNTGGLGTDVSVLISNLQDRLAEAENKIANPPQNTSIAQSLAAVNIKSAIDRGGVFKAQLDAFAEIAPDNTVISELRPIAEKGVLSQADLITNFGQIAGTIINADQDTGEETNIVSRLISSATSMVTVRQTGDIEGQTSEAIVARIEARLKDGNLQSAFDEWSGLSDRAKDISQAFAVQLQNRITAEKLASSLLQAGPSSAS